MESNACVCVCMCSSVKETLPPALGSTSQPPPVFDGTTRQITILYTFLLSVSFFVHIGKENFCVDQTVNQ